MAAPLLIVDLLATAEPLEAAYRLALEIASTTAERWNDPALGVETDPSAELLRLIDRARAQLAILATRIAANA